MPSHLTLASSQEDPTLRDPWEAATAAAAPEPTLSVVGSSTGAWPFVVELADMVEGDARKITLLQAVRLANGQHGAVIDQEALADRLQRSLDTVQQHLNALAEDEWITVHARRAPSGRWANEYRLGRSVHA